MILPPVAFPGLASKASATIVAAAAIFIRHFEANFINENKLYCNSCKYFKEMNGKYGHLW